MPGAVDCPLADPRTFLADGETLADSAICCMSALADTMGAAEFEDCAKPDTPRLMDDKNRCKVHKKKNAAFTSFSLQISKLIYAL